MGQFAEQALQAAQTPEGQRSKDELRRLRCFVLGASRGQLVHSAPSGRGTLFWNFEEAIQDDACQHLALISARPGETVFSEGAKAEDVFILLSGVVQLQLFGDESDLGGSASRPKAPIDEIVALEQVTATRPGPNCDFVLEEKTSLAQVATNQKTTLRLLRGRTEHTLPRINTPESPVSTRAALVSPKVLESPRVVSPRRALRRDDRLLRPVAEVIHALAAAIGDGLQEASMPSFQREWQQFQEHVRCRMDEKPTLLDRPRGAAVGSELQPVEEEAKDESTSAELRSPQAPPPIRQKVVSWEERATSGAILGAAACMAGGSHKWRAVAGENCRLLVMNVKFLGRAIKKELKRRRSERRQMLLNALGGPLKTLEEEKLQNLAVAAKTILYRRGEVLCHEGELRTKVTDRSCRLLVLMLGEVRCLRSEDKVPKRAGFPLGSRWMATMQSAGTLLPGHAVNEASMVAEEPEPFTVVIESAEALVLTLAYSDLARAMSSMEQLKVKVLERLSWRKSQLGTQAEATSTTSTRPRLPVPPKKELARLDPVLHDRPEIVCQSPRQPPGISHSEGKDMMTSSLSLRRPPETIECPKVHPALIPHLKGHVRLKPRQTMPLLCEAEVTSSSCDLMRSSDDWGVRRVPSKKHSLRRARSMRVGSGDSVFTEADLEGRESEELGTMSSSFSSVGGESGRIKKRATVASLQPLQCAQGEAVTARRCPPLPPMKGSEGNLRVASIERFLQKGASRLGKTLGRPRTLAKPQDDELSQVLPA